LHSERSEKLSGRSPEYIPRAWQVPPADHGENDPAIGHIIHPFTVNISTATVQVIEDLFTDLFMLVGNNE